MQSPHQQVTTLVYHTTERLVQLAVELRMCSQNAG